MPSNLSRALKWLGALLSSLAVYLFGPGNAWLIALLAMIGLDYITGVIAAILRKELSSEVGFKGILKKTLFLIVVAVAHIIDGTVGLNGTLETAVIGFLLANEGISILENCGRAGLPIPQKLIDILEQLKKKE